MSSEPERQWSTSRTQLTTVFLLIVGLYLVATVVGRAINIFELKRQQALFTATHQGLTQTIDKLRDEIQYIESDSYLEQAARSTLFWGRPGEKLIVPLDGVLQPGAGSLPTNRP